MGPPGRRPHATRIPRPARPRWPAPGSQTPGTTFRTTTNVPTRGHQQPAAGIRYRAASPAPTVAVTQGEHPTKALAFTGPATYELMPLLIRARTQRFPGVTLEARSEMLTPTQVDGLLEGTISVGLLRPPVTAGGPVVEVLRHEPLVALLPVTYPRATQINLELTDLRTSRSSATPAHRPPRSARQSSVPAVRPDSPRGSARRPASPPSLVALVAAGLGAALAPASVRQLRTNGVTRRPLRRPAQATVMLAVAYKKGPVSP